MEFQAEFSVDLFEFLVGRIAINAENIVKTEFGVVARGQESGKKKTPNDVRSEILLHCLIVCLISFSFSFATKEAIDDTAKLCLRSRVFTVYVYSNDC
mmetsp:Transcript_3093/g.6686  ORF Transcript_3093/g.6686 Transcript_3093/m.6686 type:complete len:98 (+) Transcript_3093:3984-4277(+)